MGFRSDIWEEADKFEEEEWLMCNRFELAFAFVVDVYDGMVNY